MDTLDRIIAEQRERAYSVNDNPNTLRDWAYAIGRVLWPVFIGIVAVAMLIKGGVL